MFYKRCPKCSNKITYKYVREYKDSGEIQCPYCCTTLIVSFPIIMTNSIIIGISTGVFLAMFTDLSIVWVVLAAFIVAALFQWKLDILFALSIKKENHY